MTPDSRKPIDFKVVVAGPFGVGKTSFISNISEVPVIGTEVPTTGDEALEKPTTTVGLEYGRFDVATPGYDISLLLYGTPGQPRFRFMWETVAVGADGCIILVDASDRTTWDEAEAAIDFFGGEHQATSIIGANRCQFGSDQLIDFLEWVAPKTSVPVVACDVTDHRSSKHLLTALFDQLIGDGDAMVARTTDLPLLR